MHAFQFLVIQSSLNITKKYTESLWNRIYKSMTPTRDLNLGRWEHRQTEKQKEIKSIWANSDHCGDHICGQHEVIKEITNIRKD